MFLSKELEDVFSENDARVDGKTIAKTGYLT